MICPINRVALIVGLGFLVQFIAPTNSFCQDTAKIIQINQKIALFEHSPTLKHRDTSGCHFLDNIEERMDCIYYSQTFTDSAFPAIYKYKLVRGKKGVFEESRTYYEIDRKICKVVLKKVSEGKVLWDSDVYLSEGKVYFQLDKAAKINPAAFIEFIGMSW
jgi:hypothetical protein